MAKKIEIVLEREDYQSTLDQAKLIIRFYNGETIRETSSSVPKDVDDVEVAQFLLRELLVK